MSRCESRVVRMESSVYSRGEITCWSGVYRVDAGHHPHRDRTSEYTERRECAFWHRIAALSVNICVCM